MVERTYKQLTATQKKKAASLAKKGVSQQKIAKSLGVAKQRIASHLKLKGVGKRATGTFWEDVKTVQRLEGLTWKKARGKAYNTVFWGKKRAKKAGKKFKTWQEFWDDINAEDIRGKERDELIAEEMEELYLVSV